MPSHSGTPRLVSLIRRLPQLLTIGTLASAFVFLYGWAIKPYAVRYYQGPIHYRTSSVSVYAVTDTGAPVLISINCGMGARRTDPVNDITYRPVLAENSRDWSLREMLPSVPDAQVPIGGDMSLLNAIADPHLSGGLTKWETLETKELRRRVVVLLGNPKYKMLAGTERDGFIEEFTLEGSQGDHKGALRIPLPQTMTTQAQFYLREQLDQLLQNWENQVTFVANAWLQRWQALTGTSLEPASAGIGHKTPVYLFTPAMRQGTGMVVGVDHDASSSPTFEVTLGDVIAYKVGSEDDLRKPSILFVYRLHQWVFFVILVSLLIAAAVFFSYWRWPKHLSGPELFRMAQADDSDELWNELRDRNPWAERYIVDSFFRRGAGMAPTENVIAFFWRTVRDTLHSHRVPASSDEEVEAAILLILDRAILNAIP